MWTLVTYPLDSLRECACAGSSGTGIDDVDDGLEELDDDDRGGSRPQIEHSSQRADEREGGELRHLRVLPVQWNELQF